MKMIASRDIICSLLKTNNVCGQIWEHIIMSNYGRWCLGMVPTSTIHVKKISISTLVFAEEEGVKLRSLAVHVSKSTTQNWPFPNPPSISEAGKILFENNQDYSRTIPNINYNLHLWWKWSDIWPQKSSFCSKKWRVFQEHSSRKLFQKIWKLFQLNYHKLWDDDVQGTISDLWRL